MKVISIVNTKGGAGKSTIAVNLATALAQEGYKVVLLDTDKKQESSLSFAQIRNTDKRLADIAAFAANKSIAKDIKEGRIAPEDITEDMVSANMYLPDVPDPELIIRPSGEMRLSNFLLWESAYSEFWVSDTLWPDFGYDELTQAFRDYAKRDRRFGGLSKKDTEETTEQ